MILSILIEKMYIQTQLIINKINLRISNLKLQLHNFTIFRFEIYRRILRLTAKNYFIIISFGRNVCTVEIKRNTVDRKIQFLRCFLSFFYPRIAITRDKMQHQWSGKRKPG